MSAIYDYAATLWAQMRSEWAVVAEAQYAAAVEATHGNMLNARGRARGLTTWEVFHGHPSVYGSDELRDHLAAHPRTTLRAFEAEWLDTVVR